MSKRKVLFLCTHNSCRSQLAEAIVNERLSDAWQAFSAGTQPSSAVNPLTLQVLQEIGIQHKGSPKAVSTMRGMDFDLVVTTCDEAAENCPLWLGKGRRVHLGFEDPAAVKGSAEERLAAFRKVRDEIATQVPMLLDQYQQE